MSNPDILRDDIPIDYVGSNSHISYIARSRKCESQIPKVSITGKTI
jgi:hypothetical protein